MDNHCECHCEQLKTIHPGHNRQNGQCKYRYGICRFRNALCIDSFWLNKLRIQHIKKYKRNRDKERSSIRAYLVLLRCLGKNLALSTTRLEFVEKGREAGSQTEGCRHVIRLPPPLCCLIVCISVSRNTPVESNYMGRGGGGVRNGEEG